MTPTQLKKIREQLGYSQQKLADEIGMSRNMIVMMEGGKAAIENRTEMAVRYLLLLKQTYCDMQPT